MVIIGRDGMYYRNKNEKAIKRKEEVIKMSFGEELEKFKKSQKKGRAKGMLSFSEELERFKNSQQEGYVKDKINKCKADCSCEMCKHEKNNKIEKYSTKTQKEYMKNEIDEYV